MGSIGKVSQDAGTPALAMPGRTGLKWRMAAMPEKALAMVTIVTMT
jgi:hypothetical protein